MLNKVSKKEAEITVALYPRRTFLEVFFCHDDEDSYPSFSCSSLF